MREIRVSIEVFAEIWAARKAGEPDENAILDRIIREHREVRQAATEVAQRAEKDREIQASDKESTMVFNELTPSADGFSPPSDSNNRVPHTISSQSSWWEVVEAALLKLGGEAQLFNIYKEVERLCKSVGKRIPKELEATVRGTLEDNCSESHRYKHVRDVFEMTRGRGQGMWGLKRN